MGRAALDWQNESNEMADSNSVPVGRVAALITNLRSVRFTYTWSVALYVVYLLVLSAPYWTTGFVVAPFALANNTSTDPRIATLPSEKRFSDYYNVFIPEIHEHLQGERSGFLKYWTSRTELGRPLFHTSGFSPVFLPTYVLTFVTTDASIFLSILSWSIVALTGLFVLLMCREWQFDPLTALFGGIAVASMPYLTYSLYSPVYISTICWAFGSLYGVVRVLQRRDFWSVGVLAFCVHGLLMTGYPQTIVYVGYIVTGFVVYSLVELRREGIGAVLKTGGMLLLAALLGVATSLPLYADIYALSLESERTNAAYSFFSGAAVNVRSFIQIMKIVSQLTHPEVFGNVSTGSYPFAHMNSALPAIVSLFAYFGMILAWRQSRYWVVVIGALIIMNFVPSVFWFAYEYMGFGISRHVPYELLKIPYIVCAVYGIEQLVRVQDRSVLRGPFVIATSIVMAQVCITVITGMVRSYPIYWSAVALAIGMVVVFLLQHRVFSASLTAAAFLMSTSFINFPLMLRYPVAATIQENALIRAVRTHATDDTIVATVPGNLPVLRTNYNMRLGISTIHSIDSVSPQRYRTLVTALGGKLAVYGRNNYSINPDYASTMFWMSNIDLLISPREIKSPLLSLLDIIPQQERKLTIWLYRTKSKMGKAMQIAFPSGDTVAQTVSIADPRKVDHVFPTILEDNDDTMLLSNALSTDNLLVISQKYHRYWEAQVLRGGVWEDAATTEVNGVFLGVFVPAETTSIRLAFNPNIRLMLWIMPVWGLFWMTVFLKKGFALWSRVRRDAN